MEFVLRVLLKWGACTGWLSSFSSLLCFDPHSLDSIKLPNISLKSHRRCHQSPAAPYSHLQTCQGREDWSPVKGWSFFHSERQTVAAFWNTLGRLSLTGKYRSQSSDCTRRTEGNLRQAQLHIPSYKYWTKYPKRALVHSSRAQRPNPGARRSRPGRAGYHGGGGNTVVSHKALWSTAQAQFHNRSGALTIRAMDCMAAWGHRTDAGPSQSVSPPSLRGPQDC